MIGGYSCNNRNNNIRMANYIGSKCIVCNQKFKQDDDIVVCPECGTPYHRDCYKKESKCINTQLHENHESWQQSVDAVQDSFENTSQLICDNCGFNNPPRTLFCESCGEPIKETLAQQYEAMRDKENQANQSSDPNQYNRQNQNVSIQPFLINFSDPLCGLNPEEDFNGVRLCELADFVDSNTHYYLPIFKRIKDTGRKVTWNFSAMLFPELFFANRKMPLAAIVVCIIRLVSLLPVIIETFSVLKVGGIVDFVHMFDIRSSAFQILKMLGTVLSYGLMFIGGGFANSIYYNSAVKKTATIKATTTLQELRGTLHKKGGTSVALLIIFICVRAIPYFVIWTLAMFGGLTL